MANRWGNNGNSERLFFWASKSLQMVAAAMKLKDTCSLGEKYDTHRQCIKKQRHHLAHKSPYGQSYDLPSSQVRRENWTIQKAECRRTDDSELWRRLLRVPWTTRRSNQSILKEINPEYSLQGLMLKLKLKLQCFGHLM